MRMVDTSNIQESGSPIVPAGGAGQSITPTARRGAKQTDPYDQAGSEILGLVRAFVEAVGTHIRDAQSAAESARADRADALHARYEMIKLRAETEAEAARIVDGARAEADRMRKETQAETAEFRTAVAVLERANERLAEVIELLGGNLGEPTTEAVFVIPDAPDPIATES
jgi:hypothetical protein